jgi:NTE family protein
MSSHFQSLAKALPLCTRMPEWLRNLGTSWRRMTGAHTLGLALGGGGVRGLAHIGVLTVLDREAIPVHAVAGTSMGAIVGAAYALSPDFDRERLTRQVVELGIRPPLVLGGSEEDREGFFERLRRFIDVERFLLDTMWGWGAFEGTVVADALAKLTSGKRLEEARVPLAAVATDLLSGDKIVFRKGPASLALQASSALPGFFPPIRHEGRLLVDGAFVDLVPADVAREMGARFVLAVDVDQERMRVEVSNGLQAFLRAVEIGARHHKRHHLRQADLVIRPEFGQPVDSLDFSKAELCVEAGLRATERVLPVLRRMLKSS